MTREDFLLGSFLNISISIVHIAAKEDTMTYPTTEQV